MNRSYSKIRHIQESNARLEKRFLTEQPEKEELNKIVDDMLNKTKPNDNAKYCFTRENLKNQILISGFKYIKLYKIKSGDTLSEVKNKLGIDQNVSHMNPNCNKGNKNTNEDNLKEFRVGDVIMYSTRPSM